MFQQNTRVGWGYVDWSDTVRFRSGVLRGNWILTVSAYKNFVICIFGRIEKHFRPI